MKKNMEEAGEDSHSSRNSALPRSRPWCQAVEEQGLAVAGEAARRAKTAARTLIPVAPAGRNMIRI